MDKSEVIKYIKNNGYLYLLGIATAYAFFYSLYSLYEPINSSLVKYDKLFSYLANVSILFFTTGIFSVSLKYFAFLGVFKREFSKAINSDDFENKLEKQLKQITFSEDFLLKQSNLTEIWESVTLCRYKQIFPNLASKLKKKISNELFSDDNISHYYKNFQLSYDISLFDDKYIKIIEKSSFTLVRPDKGKFKWDFSVYYKQSDDNIESKLFFKINNLADVKYDDKDIVLENFSNNFFKKTITKELHDRLEYHIERKIELIQDINIDKEFAFASDRIIDDISLIINKSDNLSVFFSTVNNNIMHRNGTHNDDEMAYINRDIFLPGEKFKIFIYKNAI